MEQHRSACGYGASMKILLTLQALQLFCLDDRIFTLKYVALYYSLNRCDSGGFPFFWINISDLTEKMSCGEFMEVGFLALFC